MIGDAAKCYPSFTTKQHWIGDKNSKDEHLFEEICNCCWDKFGIFSPPPSFILLNFCFFFS